MKLSLLFYAQTPLLKHKKAAVLVLA